MFQDSVDAAAPLRSAAIRWQGGVISYTLFTLIHQRTWFLLRENRDSFIIIPFCSLHFRADAFSAAQSVDFLRGERLSPTP